MLHRSLLLTRRETQRESYAGGGIDAEALPAGGGIDAEALPAEPVLRDTLAIQQRVLGEGHINTLVTADNLTPTVLLSNAGQHCSCTAPPITERPHAPSGVAVFMSAHSKTPYITPSMDFYSGKGVVRGRKVQQLGFALQLHSGRSGATVE